jgi:hypothetical protein
MLRDGSRPDIVLQPDLRRAQQGFVALWQAMATVLLRDDAGTPPLPLGVFSFGLQPRAVGGEMPFLCWRDGLALSASAPHDPGAVSRTLAAFGQAMAAFLCQATCKTPPVATRGTQPPCVAGERWNA